jgi:hypothetical protein
MGGKLPPGQKWVEWPLVYDIAHVSGFGMVLTPHPSFDRPATPQKTSAGVRPWVRYP